MKNLFLLIISSFVILPGISQISTGLMVHTPKDTALVAISSSGTLQPLGGYFQTGNGRGIAVKGVSQEGGDYDFGGWFQASGHSGVGVYGESSDNGTYTKYGGHFKAYGSEGGGVYGEVTGQHGRAVIGIAQYNGTDGQTFGGFFRTYADNSFGVWSNSQGKGSYGLVGESEGEDGVGAYGAATGKDGIGVSGHATFSESSTNYGGYFTSKGKTGVGVYGEAQNNTDDSEAHGGFFISHARRGAGVYGESDGIFSYGVHGVSHFDDGVFGRATNQSASVAGVKGVSTHGKGVEGRGGFADFEASGPGKDWHSSSSIRWKTNVQNIADPITKIEQMRGVSFTWDEEHGGHADIGFIAEEVGTVLPEIVNYEENGIDATGLDYSRTTALLIEAVKALRQEYLALIQELQNQIDGGSSLQSAESKSVRND